MHEAKFRKWSYRIYLA